MGKDYKDLPYRKCVGIMILNHENRVWAGHRPIIDNDEFEPSDTRRWQMPQGGIDKGEEPQAAAWREMWEETGITSAELLAEAPDWINYDLPEHLIGEALKGKYRGQTQKWFAFRFTGDESEINISSPPDGAPIEFDQWDWVDMKTLPDLIVEFKHRTYVKVVEAFAHLAS